MLVRTTHSLAFRLDFARWELARSRLHGGFGNAGVETIVELKRHSGLLQDVRVLASPDGGDIMNLRMTWLSPLILQVSYADEPGMLYFQVTKTSGRYRGTRRQPAAG